MGASQDQVAQLLRTLHRQRLEKLHRTAVSLTRKIARLFKMDEPPVVLTYDVENAATDGISVYINPRWMRRTLRRNCEAGTCVESILLGVIAHELTHIKFGDPFVFDSHGSHKRELRCDALAGYALAMLGVEPIYFTVALAEIAGHGSATHPPKRFRVDAVVNGYEAGRKRLARQRRNEAVLASIALWQLLKR